MASADNTLPAKAPDSTSITQSDVESLRTRISQLRDSIDFYEKQLTRQKSVERRLAFFSIQTRLRRFVDDFLGWRWAGILIAALAVGAVFFVVTLSWKLGIVAIAFGIAVSLWMLCIPKDAALAMDSQRLHDELAAFQAASAANAEVLNHHRATFAVASEKLQSWSALLAERQYRESRLYRRKQLAQRNWKAMRGGELEQFLEEAFRELQYTAERTGKAGDQGVDLIVTKHGHRIAVQVKGYLDSVPNTAVQEAHTGMVFYQCNACAVITNSRFTAGGKNIADRVGCALVDENTLPMLILGQIDLRQETMSAKARINPANFEQTR
jgi:HJR/Mrr/RecB family endonuclease